MNRYRRPLALRPAPEAAVPEAAMVMAAGLGKRMRPLTATRPKPLVEVAGKPLIDHCLERLRAAGVKKVVVNVHYLADSLEAHLRSRFEDLEIVISNERKQPAAQRQARILTQTGCDFTGFGGNNVLLPGEQIGGLCARERDGLLQGQRHPGGLRGAERGRKQQGQGKGPPYQTNRGHTRLERS